MTLKVRDPHHPILDQPWEYRIAELRYVVATSDQEGVIEMILTKESERQRLRFLSPREFSVDRGCSLFDYIGLQIIDVSARQWDDIGVEVSCFENTPGLRFLARTVEAF